MLPPITKRKSAPSLQRRNTSPESPQEGTMRRSRSSSSPASTFATISPELLSRKFTGDLVAGHKIISHIVSIEAPNTDFNTIFWKEAAGHKIFLNRPAKAIAISGKQLKKHTDEFIRLQSLLELDKLDLFPKSIIIKADPHDELSKSEDLINGLLDEVNQGEPSWRQYKIEETAIENGLPDNKVAHSFKLTLPLLKGLPSDRWWKLFIDHDRQQGGRKEFDEKEPGYHDAMMNALSFVLEGSAKKFSADEYIKLHDIAIDNVFKDAGRKKSFDKGVNFKGQGYGIVVKNEDEFNKALQELREEKVLSMIDERDLETDSKYIPALKHIYAAYEGKDIKGVERAKARISSLFEGYYENIEKTKDPDAKLRFIVQLCRALEVGHYFTDGNQRTTVFLLLNKLLMDEEFDPAIVNDPYVFDGYFTIKSLVEKVKEGQNNFRQELKGSGN